MGHEHGCVCMFCGAGFGYKGDEPDEATLKAAYEHEAECPRNPYKAEIERLKTQLGYVEGQLAYYQKIAGGTLSCKFCGDDVDAIKCESCQYAG